VRHLTYFPANLYKTNTNRGHRRDFEKLLSRAMLTPRGRRPSTAARRTRGCRAALGPMSRLSQRAARGIHGLQGDELRLLRALRREHPHTDFVLLPERKAPLSVDGAQKLIERLVGAGDRAARPRSPHARRKRTTTATPSRQAAMLPASCRRANLTLRRGRRSRTQAAPIR